MTGLTPVLGPYIKVALPARLLRSTCAAAAAAAVCVALSDGQRAALRASTGLQPQRRHGQVV